MIGGNGYLSVYLCGIILGNSYLPHKRDMVLFFDVLTGVAQMMIFFLLGLLVTPSELPQVILPSLVIMIFLTFVGRPVSVAALLAGFRSSKGQIGLVSWAMGAWRCLHCICYLCSPAPGSILDIIFLIWYFVLYCCLFPFRERCFHGYRQNFR